MDSDGLSGRSASVALTLFEFHGATARSLDLTQAPLSRDHPAWTASEDYTATQSLAQAARQSGIELIRYESVRNPAGICLALLGPAVFDNAAQPYRHQQQTWSLTLLPPDQIVLQRHLEPESWSFRFPPRPPSPPL
jgi:hypothetical protein